MEVPQRDIEKNNKCVCVCITKETVAISQTNEVSVHQWLVCQISRKDLWSMVTMRGYKKSTRPQELILRVCLSTWSSDTALNYNQHQWTNLTWDKGRLATQIGQIQSVKKAGIFFDKLFNVQARLLLHILRRHAFERLYCMNHETEERGKTNELLSHFRKIPSSTFFAIPSTSKLLSLTFNFTDEGRGGQGGWVDIKH